MIGLSPLSSGHPPGFQPRWVRPSTGSYPRFSLPKDSSPGFASTACDSCRPVQTRFRCGSLVRLGLAAYGDSLAHSTKGTPSRPLACRSGCSKARGFRCCFTPLSGCFSPFPHGTRSLSVAGECSALEGGPPGFGPDSSWPALLGKEDARSGWLRLRGSHPLRPAFPGRSAARRISHRARGLEPPDTSPRNTDKPAPPGCDGHVGLGVARVRSPLLARSRLISLPPST